MPTNKKRPGSIRNDGFTLIELMTVVVVIGILASISLANYNSARERSIDAAMKSDLRGAMVYIEDYRIQNDQLPPDLATFQSDTGFKLSPGVRWDKFQLANRNGEDTMDLQLRHPQSAHMWYADYPASGTKISQQ